MQQYYKTTTEFNCGIDLHARQMYVCVVDPKGEVVRHCNIEGNDFEVFLKKIEPFRKSLTVVCECTFNWYWLADACYDAKIPFVLAHALYLGLIHGGKKKNDRIDSEKLAQLLRSNMIPTAYVYPAERRPVRDLLRLRTRYVWDRSEHIGSLQRALIAHNLPEVPRSQASDRHPWFEQVLELHTNPLNKLAAQSRMKLIELLDEQVAKLEWAVMKQTKLLRNAELSILLSVPGIGQVLGLTILHEMDTVERFETVQDFCSYCRLVKGSVESAGKIKGLRGGKMGNPYLKWAFHEAAILAKRAHPYIKDYAARLEKEHGKFVANAILAHKLARAVYFMLKNRTTFDPKEFAGKA